MYRPGFGGEEPKAVEEPKEDVLSRRPDDCETEDDGASLNDDGGENTPSSCDMLYSCDRQAKYSCSSAVDRWGVRPLWVLISTRHLAVGRALPWVPAVREELELEAEPGPGTWWTVIVELGRVTLCKGVGAGVKDGASPGSSRVRAVNDGRRWRWREGAVDPFLCGTGSGSVRVRVRVRVRVTVCFGTSGSGVADEEVTEGISSICLAVWI